MPRPHPHSMHARSISCLNSGVFVQNISQISNMHRWKSTRCQYSLALLPSFKWMFLTDAVSQICIFYFKKKDFHTFSCKSTLSKSPLSPAGARYTGDEVRSTPFVLACWDQRLWCRTHRRCAAPAAGVRSVLLVSNRTREAIGSARHSRPRPPSHIRNLSTQKETVGINPFDDVSEEWILVLFQQKCMIFKCSQALWLLVWQSSAALNTLVYVWRATQQLISVSFTKLRVTVATLYATVALVFLNLMIKVVNRMILLLSLHKYSIYLQKREKR